MKKLFALVAILLTSALTPALADDAANLLGKLREQIRSYTSYRIHLTASVEGEGNAKGTITVSGQRFAAKIMRQELYYDGTTLWNYSPSEKEVIIENMNPADPNVLANPSKLLNVDPADYNYRSLPSVTSGKETLQVVELTPKTATPDYSAIRLYISSASAIPQRISIDSPSVSTPIELHISKVESNIPVDTGTFRFDPKAHRGVEVIDFR